jgi:hypothetical protein
VGGKRGTRNSPTIINVAYYTTQFCRENPLEKQAEGPVQNPVEMPHSSERLTNILGDKLSSGNTDKYGSLGGAWTEQCVQAGHFFVFTSPLQFQRSVLCAI